VGFIEAKLKDHVMEGLGKVRLFGTIFSHQVIPPAKRTTKMWEYSDCSDLDRVLPEVVSDEKVWSWLEMVLKVGNQLIVGGPSPFDKEHPLNLVSFSSFLLSSPSSSDRVLTLPCFSGAWSSPVLSTTPEGGKGHGQASRTSGGFPGQEGEESKKGQKKVQKGAGDCSSGPDWGGPRCHVGGA
jgi:hypothetical protein